MRVNPSSEDWKFARRVHSSFSSKPGSEHIATAFSLAHLSALLSAVKPTSVLEFGAGIGTITYSVLTHPSNVARVTTTETNSFCRERFAENIPEDLRPRCELLSDLADLRAGERHYDLVIIDSFNVDMGYRFVEAGTHCFVDGNRLGNREKLRSSLEERGLACDLVNYNRGTRYFVFSMHTSKRTGRRRPAFQLRKVKRGCWIGAVSERSPVESA